MSSKKDKSSTNKVDNTNKVENKDTKKVTPTKTKGLGDVIANITKAIGIEPCDACERRREQFNKWFPNTSYTRDLTEQEIELLTYAQTAKIFKSEQVDQLFNMFNELLKPRNKVQRCNCPSVLKQIIEQLTKLI